MSRFGRNYLEVGFYTEIMFPSKGVRFIAVNNNIDSSNPGDNDFTPFLNIMNEWYAKDTSKKIRTIFRSRMKDGKRCSGSIPYGYRKAPEDKNHLIIDEAAANVVRRIFQMKASGCGNTQIANILTEEKVLTPSAYAERYNPNNCRHHPIDPYKWTPTTIGYILDRREYIGDTVLGKTISENFKTKSHRKATQDELLIFENTHEPIIDQDTWEIVRRNRASRKTRLANGSYSHRLSGLVFCGDCGARMTYRSPEAAHRPNGKTYDSDSSFICGNYRTQKEENCTMHYVKTSTLETIALASIQSVVTLATLDKKRFANSLRKIAEQQQGSVMKETKKELSMAKKRMGELDELIRNLYEANTKGTISDRQCKRLMEEYDSEQADLEKRIDSLSTLLENGSAQSTTTERFTKLIERYSNITELTDTILHEFIEKIVVYEKEENDGVQLQRIDVYFSYVGKLELPEFLTMVTQTLMRMKLEADASKETEEERLARLRETSKRFRAKRAAKKQALKEAAEAGDEQAKIEYEEIMRKQRERNRAYREKQKAQKAALEAVPEGGEQDATTQLEPKPAATPCPAIGLRPA